MAAKKNFKKLASEHHPDRGGNVDSYKGVVEAFQVIEVAYQTATTNGADHE